MPFANLGEFADFPNRAIDEPPGPVREPVSYTLDFCQYAGANLLNFMQIRAICDAKNCAIARFWANIGNFYTTPLTSTG